MIYSTTAGRLGSSISLRIRRSCARRTGVSPYPAPSPSLTFSCSWGGREVGWGRCGCASKHAKLVHAQG